MLHIAIGVVLAGGMHLAATSYGMDPLDPKLLGLIAVALSLVAFIDLNFVSLSPQPYIKEIFIHPVKSLAGVSLDEATIDEYGFKWDRIYMVCEPDTDKKSNPNGDPNKYRAVTMREVPQFGIIKTTINEDNNTLTLHYDPKSIKLTVPLDCSDLVKQRSPRAISTYIWGQTPDSYDLGSVMPEIGQFFDQVRNSDKGTTTIVAPKERRPVTRSVDQAEVSKSSADPRTSFQDYYPGNLITEHSLQDLYKRVYDNTNGEVRISARNFRANMVIAGTKGPWDEDDWKKIRIGQNSWLVACRNVRCQVPTVNLQSGTFEPTHEPYKTMQSFRRIDEGAKYKPCFGMNLVNLQTGYKVKVGDELRVLSRGKHFYIPI